MCCSKIYGVPLRIVKVVINVWMSFYVWIWIYYVWNWIYRAVSSIFPILDHETLIHQTCICTYAMPAWSFEKIMNFGSYSQKSLKQYRIIQFNASSSLSVINLYKYKNTKHLNVKALCRKVLHKHDTRIMISETMVVIMSFILMAFIRWYIYILDLFKYSLCIA